MVEKVTVRTNPSTFMDYENENQLDDENRVYSRYVHPNAS
jgi:hypothetical protein